MRISAECRWQAAKTQPRPDHPTMSASLPAWVSSPLPHCLLASELGEQLLRVQMIDLFQNRIRQIQPVNLPAALAGRAPIIEGFVGSFEPTEKVPVHLRVHAVVAAEHYPVLILDEKLACQARLAAKFRLAATELHHDVGIANQHAGH